MFPSRNFPGFRILWNILGISAFVPRIPGITFGKDPVTYKHDDFAYFGCDVFTLASTRILVYRYH